MVSRGTDGQDHLDVAAASQAVGNTIQGGGWTDLLQGVGVFPRTIEEGGIVGRVGVEGGGMEQRGRGEVVHGAIVQSTAS